jgi:hypothetical protein
MQESERRDLEADEVREVGPRDSSTPTFYIQHPPTDDLPDGYPMQLQDGCTREEAFEALLAHSDMEKVAGTFVLYRDLPFSEIPAAPVASALAGVIL